MALARLPLAVSALLVFSGCCSALDSFGTGSGHTSQTVRASSAGTATADAVLKRGAVTNGAKLKAALTGVNGSAATGTALFAYDGSAMSFAGAISITNLASNDAPFRAYIKIAKGPFADQIALGSPFVDQWSGSSGNYQLSTSWTLSGDNALFPQIPFWTPEQFFDFFVNGSTDGGFYVSIATNLQPLGALNGDLLPA